MGGSPAWPAPTGEGAGAPPRPPAIGIETARTAWMAEGERGRPIPLLIVLLLLTVFFAVVTYFAKVGVPPSLIP